MNHRNRLGPDLGTEKTPLRRNGGKVDYTMQMEDSDALFFRERNCLNMETKESLLNQRKK